MRVVRLRRGIKFLLVFYLTVAPLARAAGLDRSNASQATVERADIFERVIFLNSVSGSFPLPGDLTQPFVTEKLRQDKVALDAMVGAVEGHTSQLSLPGRSDRYLAWVTARASYQTVGDREVFKSPGLVEEFSGKLHSTSQIFRVAACEGLWAIAQYQAVPDEVYFDLLDLFDSDTVAISEQRAAGKALIRLVELQADVSVVVIARIQGLFSPKLSLNRYAELLKFHNQIVHRVPFSNAEVSWLNRLRIECSQALVNIDSVHSAASYEPH